jgi:flagellin
MAINISSSGSFTSISSLNNNPTKEFNRLSSGQRITSAADDASGVAISSRFDTQQNGFNTAIRNANDGISFYQTAESALGSLTQNLQRIRALALSANNGTLNSTDRQALQKEVTQLQNANQRILDNSQFNGVSFFKSPNQLRFQAGPNAGDQITVNTDLSKVINASKSVSVANPQSASSAIKNIDASLSSINQARSEFGAVQNRLQSSIDYLSQAGSNAAQSNSRIKDANFAKETSSLVQKNILNQVSIAVQAQANASQKNVLQLFKS